LDILGNGGNGGFRGNRGFGSILPEADARKRRHTPKAIFFLTKLTKKRNKKKDMQIPIGSVAVVVKAAGHFFGRVGLWVAKK